ncbi:MAG TPA: tRNA pseudouridine(55) synthase TruB [Gemmatimonadaceae bacterium]|nr:tRNA pseudouridine(55) synthase TruB [Gemmatimonadaceae bacterium]
MRATSTDALLLVDKPAGLSSHDVVALARRALGTRKVGHGGTLDPFATGLLVLLAGRGTRLLQFVPADPKVYEATIRFGRETDTDDGTGTTTAEAPAPEPARVVAALPALTGALQQVPPAFSAKHVGGQRAYALARRGEPAELPPVPVRVDAWEVLELAPGLLRARITCGTGTYIRSLARDLGRATGSAAHLEALRRVRVGPFGVAEADGIDALRAGQVQRHELREALGDLPVQVLTGDEVRRARHGMHVPATVGGARAALVDAHGELVAVASRDDASWHPDVVLPID